MQFGTENQSCESVIDTSITSLYSVSNVSTGSMLGPHTWIVPLPSILNRHPIAFRISQTTSRLVMSSSATIAS